MFISVGELNENKNQSVIIQAMEMLKEYNIHYLLCGQGTMKEELIELAAELHIQEQVHFLGFRNDVSELYRCSDIFVFPSKREGLSVALMEAMACGLPVICSKIRGNVDLIENRKGGYLVEENDAEAYAKAIEILLQKKESAKEMGLWNYQKIKKFDVEYIKKCMKAQVYEKI